MHYALIHTLWLPLYSSYYCSVNCKIRNRQVYENDYDLINKSDIATQYLLSDDSISLLKFIEKPNPINSRYKPMKLYLRKQARIKSFKRWTDEAGLNAELEKRKNLKLSKIKDDVDEIDFSNGGIQSLYGLSSDVTNNTMINQTINAPKKKAKKESKNKRFSFTL